MNKHKQQRATSKITKEPKAEDPPWDKNYRNRFAKKKQTFRPANLDLSVSVAVYLSALSLYFPDFLGNRHEVSENLIEMAV